MRRTGLRRAGEEPAAMPYVLAAPVALVDRPLFGEGAPYTTDAIFTRPPTPVRYDAHTLKPHSLCHMDAPAHIVEGGATVDAFFTPARLATFYGPAYVVKIAAPAWEPSANGGFVHRIARAALQSALARLGATAPPDKVLVSCDPMPTDEHGMHDPNYALVLDVDAAEWLATNSAFALYGTSYKSTDHQPNSPERPIHRIVFRTGVAMELLALGPVPEGVYWFAGFPLPLVGASEAPVCPVLFTRAELAW